VAIVFWTPVRDGGRQNGALIMRSVGGIIIAKLVEKFIGRNRKSGVQ